MEVADVGQGKVHTSAKEYDFPDTPDRVVDSTDYEEADNPTEDLEKVVEAGDEIGTESKHKLNQSCKYLYDYCLV